MKEKEEFTEFQLKKLSEYVVLFKEYTKTKKFEEERLDRQNHHSRLRNLTKDRVLGLGEYEFNDIVSNLWAMRIWGSPEFPMKRIHRENDFDKLKSSLANLLFGVAEISSRYDRLRKETKFIGMAIATELLCLVNPEEYGIWNAKAREGLRILGFEGELPLNRPQINGTQYMEFLDIVGKINTHLKQNGFPDSDLLLVDYFLYEVVTAPTPSMQGTEVTLDIDHDELADSIREIGEWLGFQCVTNHAITKGVQVDVVWSWRVGNIGEVKYVFEVQKKGNIKSALFNLLKALGDPAVQKVVVVSDRNQLEKFRVQAEGTEIAKSLAYWDEAEVYKIHSNLQETYEILSQLDLMKPKS